MVMKAAVLPVALGGAWLLAAAPPETGGGGVVHGRALYRERIALPPGAVFEATLEDVSRAGGKSEVLGSARIEGAGPVPIRFDIPYDPAKVDERHSYAVRARILDRDRLLFTTDRVYPVLTRGAGNDVELLLVRARGPAVLWGGGGVPLEGTHWTLVELGGATVAGQGPREAYLELDAETRRVAGSGGCNRLSGEYERDGDRLRFPPLAATRRACLQGMDTEASFLAAIDRVRGFRIDEGRLELLDRGGRTLAALEARARPSGR